MNVLEKITLILGTLLIIGISVFPPLVLNGHSSTAEMIERQILRNQEEHRRMGVRAPNVIVVPKGDHGVSESPYINWKDERRGLVFDNFSFNEEVTFQLIFSENDIEEFEGKISWESKINTGRFLIEIVITIVITFLFFLLLRYK